MPGPFCHEDWTSRFILDPGSEVHRVLAEHDPQMPARVERLVHGQASIPHLARAVSGTSTSIAATTCCGLSHDRVRCGVLDLDWLLQALRLHVSPGASAASLAVDGEKGLTAVEGFFLGRLYMYRQVYLHKAVRAAEAVMRAMFRRLSELPPVAATPAGLEALVRGRDLTVGELLDLDDHELESAIRAYCDSDDALLAGLARRLRGRRLFKTMRLRRDVPRDVALGRLRAVVASAGVGPEYLCDVDRVEVEAYAEDEALMVLVGGGRLVRLLDASPVLHGLSRETFVHYRAVFPGEVRERVRRELADLV